MIDLALVDTTEEFSTFLEKVNLELDETEFAELLPRFKAAEEKILSAQKEKEEEDHMHGR